jgi:hypothetical protein
MAFQVIYLALLVPPASERAFLMASKWYLGNQKNGQASSKDKRKKVPRDRETTSKRRVPHPVQSAKCPLRKVPKTGQSYVRHSTALPKCWDGILVLDIIVVSLDLYEFRKGNCSF